MPDEDILAPVLDHKTPPATVREVGIHLIYMSKNMADISKKLDNMSGTYAHKQELADAICDRKEDQRLIIDDIVKLTKRVVKLEDYNDIIKSTIAKWAIVALVLMLLTVYGMEKLFK